MVVLRFDMSYNPLRRVFDNFLQKLSYCEKCTFSAHSYYASQVTNRFNQIFVIAYHPKKNPK